MVAGPLQHRPALQRGQRRHSGQQNRRPTEDRRAHSHPGRRTQQTEGSVYRAGDLPRPGTWQHHDRNDPSRDTYGTRKHHDRNDKPRDTYGSRKHHDSNKPRSTYDTWQHDDCQNTVWGNYNSDYYYDWNQAYAWQTSMYHFPPLQGHRDTADCHNPDNLQCIPMAQQQQQSTEVAQSQNSTQDCGARDGATRSDTVPEEAGCMTVRETAPPDNQPTGAIQSSAADQNAQRQDSPHDTGSEASDDSTGSEDTMCDNKQL